MVSSSSVRLSAKVVISRASVVISAGLVARFSAISTVSRVISVVVAARFVTMAISRIRFVAGFTAFSTVSRVIARTSMIVAARFATLSAMFHFSARLLFARLFYAFVFLNKRVNTILFFR